VFTANTGPAAQPELAAAGESRYPRAMKTLSRFLEVLALSLWVGGIVFLSSILAPNAFLLLPAYQAGLLVGATLTRLHLLGYFATLLFLVARLIGAVLAPPSDSFSRATLLMRPAVLAVLVMFLITVVAQQGVRPRMDAARAEMIATSGTADRAPLGSPLREEFDRLHRVSVYLEGAVLLLGLAAMFCSARESARV
jgi:uncharacterized membrane protein